MANIIQLYNNYYSKEMYDFARMDLLEISQDTSGAITEPSEEDIINHMYELETIQLDDFEYKFKSYLKSIFFGLLCVGTVSRWNGTFDGGMMINNYNDFLRLLEDCSSISVYIENGHLYVRGSHHDGNNFYELKELTEEGHNIISDYENCCSTPYWSNLSKRELHQRMFNSSKYTHLCGIKMFK